MAAVHNLYIDQGADFSADIGIFDDFNTAWDLTGYTGAAKIKKSYYSSTSTLAEGRYLYDVVITSAAGSKTRVIEGLVTINPGVTT